MSQETTRTLSRKLQSVTDVSEAESFIEKHAEDTAFHIFLNKLIAEKDISIPELIDRSGVSKNYIYNILSGKRSHPGRDKVLAICIGLGASFQETNRALEMIGHSALYPKNERDTRIAIAVNQRTRNVTDVNIMLEKHGLPPLDV